MGKSWIRILLPSNFLIVTYYFKSLKLVSSYTRNKLALDFKSVLTINPGSDEVKQ